MKRRTVPSFFAVLFLSTAAFAQEAPSPSPNAALAAIPQDPAKIAIATKILTETNARGNIELLLNSIIPQIAASIKKQSPNISDDTIKTISGMMLDEMDKQLPQMLNIQAVVYANHFSLDELKSVDEFYQSPAGQKTIVEAPKIMTELLPLGEEWGRQAAQNTLQDVIQKLRAQGVKI